MKKTAILIAALAGTLLAFQVQAQSPGQTYFGIGYGAVWTDGASPYTNTIDEDNVGGAKIYGGSMWNNFGLEVGLYSLGKYDVKFAGAKIADTSTMAAAVSGVMATPLGGGFSFHGKLGLAFTQAEFSCRGAPCATQFPVGTNTTSRGISGLLGLGIGAMLAQDVMLRVDYEHFGNVHHQIGTTKYNDSYDILSVNVQFNF